MSIEANAGLALALFVGVIAPVAGHTVMERLNQKRDTAILRGEYGRALNLEDSGLAALAVGWVVCGMMAMALLVSPFMGT